MAEYAAFLLANPSELDLLFKEMLIGVTNFFRDPEVWDELNSVVLPELFARTGPDRRFRAWVAGCSTGEEAFSLAMVFTEARERLPGPAASTLQIFATDLNADADCIRPARTLPRLDSRGCFAGAPGPFFPHSG
jgi:two-component system, chemotaxis family, CheB/CheR fusion protein